MIKETYKSNYRESDHIRKFNVELTETNTMETFSGENAISAEGRKVEAKENTASSIQHTMEEVKIDTRQNSTLPDAVKADPGFPFTMTEVVKPELENCICTPNMQVRETVKPVYIAVPHLTGEKSYPKECSCIPLTQITNIVKLDHEESACTSMTQITDMVKPDPEECTCIQITQITEIVKPDHEECLCIPVAKITKTVRPDPGRQSVCAYTAQVTETVKADPEECRETIKLDDVKECVCTTVSEIIETVKPDHENDDVCKPESHMNNQ